MSDHDKEDHDAFFGLDGEVEFMSEIITRLREHLPWRVDSVNSPCRSKVVSFLKVANAATLPPLVVATLDKNVLVASQRGVPAGVRLSEPNESTNPGARYLTEPSMRLAQLFCMLFTKSGSKT